MKIAKKRGRTAINGLAVFLFLIFGRCFTSDALLSPRGRLPSSPLLARVESGQSDSRPIDPTQSSAPIPFRASRNQNKRYGTWLAASPSLLGFNRETLETTVNRIGRMKGVYSVILARNGYLIAEQYFREGYRTKPHNMKSASKSVLSALVGIAMDEGVLSLDLPISDILPAGKELNDPRKADITVKHLLTMTTGLKATSYQAYSSWVLNGDWVKAALDQPLVADPGTHFQYSTGNTHLLSAVLTAATGMSTKEYAIQKLFGPMDITIHGWDTDPKGIYQGGNNLLLVPRDMARIGQLYLDGGKYRGHQLVPKPWVEESTRAGSFGKNDVYGSYGYLWFCRPGDNDAFVAVGFGGQYIYASRQHESVIAVTATLESKGRVWEKHLFDLIHEGIFGSIESDPRPVLRLAGQKGVDPLQDRGSLRAIGGGTNKDSGVPRLYPISQTTRNVILRRRPSQQSRRLGLVPAGTRIDILDTQGQWHQIQFNDRKGWLFSPYVNTFISEKPDSLAEAAGLIAYESNEPKPLSKTPSGDPDSPPIAAMVSEAGLAAVRLNLRTGPSQTDSIIRILSAGTPLKLKEKIGSWYRVRVGQFDGWVFADYVQILPEKVRMLAEKPGEVTEASPEEKQPPIPAPSRKKITIGDLHQVPAETQEDMRETVARLETRLLLSEKAQEQLGETLKSLQEEEISSQAESARAESDRESEMSELVKTREVLEDQRRVTRAAEAAHKALLAEMDGVKTQIVALKEALRRGRSNRDNQKTELLEFNQEMQAQQTAASLAVTERRRLSAILTRSQKQIDSLQTSLKEFLTESRIAREKLRDELSTVTTALEEQERLAAVERVGSEERESELEGMQGQIRALGENLAVALKTTQRDRDRLTSEMALLRQDLKAQQNKDIRKEMAGLQAQIAALNDETLERMESLREDQETSLLALGRKIKTQQAAAALSEADRKRLGMAVIASQNRIESLQTALAESLAESAAARGNLRDELSLAQTALKKQLQEAHLSEKNSKALAAALDGTNTLIAALKETVMAMKAGRETANAALSAATREQINSLQTVFAEALLESGTAREKMSDELAMVRVALEKQIQAERQSDADRKELAGALDVAGSRIAALNERVLGMDSGRDTINTALATQNQDLQRQKETDLLSKSERELMRTEMAAATQQMGELRKNLTEVLAEREVLKGELAAVKQELKDQHQTNEQSKATRKSLISEQVWVRTQLSELGDEIRAPRSAPQQPIAEEPGKSKDRKLLDDFIAGASRERTRLETELAATQERVEELQLSMAESREIRKDQDSKWNEVHHAIEAQRKSATVSESARSELKVDLAAASNQIEALQTLLKASQTKQNSLAEEVSTVKTTLENQHKDALTSETDRASLLSEIDGVRTRTVALGETLGQIRSIRDNQKAEISELNRELQILKKDKVQIDSVNKALVAELDTVKKQMKDQEAALVNSQAFREEQTLERAEARKQRGALQTSLKESRTGQDTLVAELLTIKKELRSQKLAAHRAEAAGMELETRLTAYNNQILTLKAKVASLQASPKRISKPAAGPSIDSQKPKEPSTDPVRMAGAGREPTLSRTQGEQNLLPRSSPKFDIIDAFARSWADSWQSKDIKAYLAHYSEDFQPGGGANLTSWTQQRRKRLLKPAFIEIELRSIRHKKVGATRALVTFDQRYRSDTYADRSAKTLELRWEREGWKILKETSH